MHTILAGLDEDGVGAIYSFDPVGSYEREQCRAGGSASSLIMPFLDNAVNFKNQYVDGQYPRPRHPLDVDQVIKLVKDAFTSATERQIEVGDELEYFIITKDGIAVHRFPLKKD